MMGALGYQVGWQEPVYIPNPAAGAGWSHPVDGRYYQRLIAAQFTLTTDAVVGNRFPQLQLTDSNGKLVTAVPAGNFVAASTVVVVSLTLGGPAYATGAAGAAFGFIPDFLIPPGWVWSLVTSGIDPGDQVTGGVLLVQRFPNDSASFTVSE
jgi:hypothetical protein